jgi:hypothetical protein
LFLGKKSWMLFEQTKPKIKIWKPRKIQTLIAFESKQTIEWSEWKEKWRKSERNLPDENERKQIYEKNMGWVTEKTRKEPKPMLVLRMFLFIFVSVLQKNKREGYSEKRKR